MLESLVAAFRIPELKRRIQFNLAMFAVFAVGAHIPVPGVDHEAVARVFGGSGGILGLVDVFSGVSLVIFSGIMLSLPYQSSMVARQVSDRIVSPFAVGLLVALFIVTIYAIVFITQGQRKIPIQHAKRVVGMKVTQGGSSFLPIK